MAPSVVIDIHSETIQAIQDGDGERLNLLIRDIEKANDRIVSLIRNYETEKDHKGRGHRFHPINTLAMNEDGHGDLTIFFPVNIFNGCKGIDADFDDKVNITIAIDFEKKTALLTGDERMPVREPDDC